MKKATADVCFYCERKIERMTGNVFPPLLQTVDHIIPRIKGGTNEKKNLVPACHVCNLEKGGMLLPEFIAHVQRLINLDKIYGGLTIKQMALVVRNASALLLNNQKAKSGKAVGDILLARKRKTKPVPTLTHVKHSHTADVHLSVNTNTFTRRQTSEEILYLQRQTLEQFEEAKKRNETLAQTVKRVNSEKIIPDAKATNVKRENHGSSPALHSELTPPHNT